MEGYLWIGSFRGGFRINGTESWSYKKSIIIGERKLRNLAREKETRDYFL